MVFGKLHHIDICVEDLEKTVEYFTEKLGWKLVRRTKHAGGAIELVPTTGGVIFEFHEATKEYKRKLKEGKRVWGTPYFNHISFEVDDLDKTCEQLKNKGVPFKDEKLDKPHIVPETGRRLANTFDADGRRWIQLQEAGRS